LTRFEIIDHTADIGIIAYGRDEKEVFATAAYAMFSLIAELDGVDGMLCREIEVTADDKEALLVAWLNELLYLFDVEHVIFNGFEVMNLEERRLRANAYGEKFDPLRHVLKTQVKAATYHMLKVEKGNGFRAQIIFDV
jgi:SHS2 domain-containing protein